MAGVARPSLRLRAVIALVLLLGFYIVTLGAALLLLALGALLVYASVAGDRVSFGYGTLVLLAICVLPALMLIYGVFTARTPPFKAGRELRREEAPKLFEMLAELSVAAKTRAPTRVYLETMPNAGVTQVGGFLGIGSTRVLLLGVPLLHLLRVRQMRAVLAHEYGHFVGSDTQLAGIHGYTHALFASVLQATMVKPAFVSSHFAFAAGQQVAAHIGAAIARFYARIYFRITHALSRRQELAADALAARIAGSETIGSALGASLAADLYGPYLDTEVVDVINAGAMPTNLLQGFDAFRTALGESEQGRELLDKLRDQATDPFDSHPALRERLDVLAREPHEVPSRPGDDEPSTSLLALDLEAWLLEATMAKVERPLSLSGPPPPLQLVPWADVPERAFEPRSRNAARKVAEGLHPMFPQAATLGAMFGAVVDGLEQGGLWAIATRIEPRIASVPAYQQQAASQKVATGVLAVLFEGALVEKGARAKLSFAKPFVVWSYEGNDVIAGKLAVDAFAGAEGRARIRDWAARLAR